MKLNGIEVSRQAYDTAVAIKRRGGKVFLSLPEITADELAVIKKKHPDAGDCGNCQGWGYVALQFVTAGPFKSPPPPILTKEEHQVAAWLENGWYRLKILTFPCPLCQLDHAPRAAARVDNVQGNGNGYRRRETTPT